MSGPGDTGGATPPRRLRKFKVTPLDILIIAVAIAFLAYVYQRIENNLVYHWDWAQIFPFFFRFDAEQNRWLANILIEGVIITLRVSIWGAMFGMLFGLVMGLSRCSAVPILRMISRGYVELVRNMPPVPFLFIMFFFVGNQILKPMELPTLAKAASPEAQQVIVFLFGELNILRNFTAAVVALAIYEGAYVTEIVRAGIQSIERGQWEAGGSLGLSRFDQLRDVILPQALQRITPPLANQSIQLIKDSSLVSLLSIQELTFIGMEIAHSTYRFFETWILVAVMYFVVCYGLSRLYARLERRMKKGRA